MAALLQVSSAGADVSSADVSLICAPPTHPHQTRATSQGLSLLTSDFFHHADTQIDYGTMESVSEERQPVDALGVCCVSV